MSDDLRHSESTDPEAGVGPSALAGLRAEPSGQAAPTEVLAEGSTSAAPAHAPRHFAAPAAGTLAPTATSAYAHACEIVGVALADLNEYNQAVGSLTQVLPTVAASRREGRDGYTEQMPFVPAGQPPVEPNGAQAGERRHGLPRAAIVLIVLAVLVATGVGGFLALGGPEYIASMMAEVDEAAVVEVLEADDSFMRGFASPDYVEERSYGLSDVKITQTVEEEDGTVRVDATATLANEFFESDCLVVLDFVRASQADSHPEFDHVTRPEDGVWIGYVVQATAETKALAGVTHDPEFPEGFSATFDAESQTCSYTHEEPFDLWFGTRTASTAYTYVFDGSAWTRSAGETTTSLAISAEQLEGAYGSSEGDAVRMGSFKIVSFDPASSTFTIEYRASTSGLSPQTISGVLSCALEVAPADDASASYRQADGYVYAFQGEGTSTGGDGGSQIQGYLGLDGSIIFDFAGDYTKPAFLFGDPSNETMSVSGIVERQGK